MESQYFFKVYYEKTFVLSIVACTKWEAVDKAFYKFLGEHPNLERKKFKAIKK
jgi:hypothetical protein